MSEKDNILAGFHAVETNLSKNRIQEVFVDSARRDRRMQDLLKVLTALEIPIRLRNKNQLDKLTGGIRHQGIAARTLGSVVRKGLVKYLKNIDQPLLLILDGLNDPVNFGSCVRSAAVAGVDCIGFPKHHGCGLTPTAARVAAGGAAAIPIFEESNWGPMLESMKKLGIWLIGLDEKATMNLYTVDLSVPTALIIGSEDKGIRHLTRQKCDDIVCIPTTGGIKSLNAGTAASVAIFEACRQRMTL